MPLPLPAVVPPDPNSLVRAIARQLDDADLLEIAQADWGEDVQGHLRELRRIARQGHVPRPIGWEPKEVLELTRWSEPDPDWPIEKLLQAHWQRAFACAALLRAYGEPENHKLDFFGQSTTIIHLIASLRALDADLDAEAAALFVWLIPRLSKYEENDYPFYGLGLLWLALAPSMNLSDEVLLTLIEWIMLSKDAVLGQYRENCGAPPAGPWLLSLIDDDSGHEIWKQLGMWLVERLRPQHGAAVVDGIQLFRAMLNPYA